VHSVTKGKVPIEIRVVGDERLPDGTPIEERIAFLKEAQRYVDMIILSTGTLIYPEPFSYNMPSYYCEPGLNVDAAAAFKEALDIPISVVGGISTLEQAEEIIKTGKADIVAMAKALMADPLLVTKGSRGHEEDIRPCMRCMYCLRGDGETHLDGCAVNPTLGWEYRYRYAENQTAKPKKVMIAGGGPGGMKAARILTAKGHDVVLYEKSDKLGGRLAEASAMWLKDGFRRYHDYAVKKTMSCGAEIKLCMAADEVAVKAEAPDVLIIATGGEPIAPPITGIGNANVYGVSDVDKGAAKISGDSVVICGAGLSGTECGIELARAGKKVTLVDMRPKEQIYAGFNNFMRPQILMKLREYGIETIDNAAVKVFLPEGVKVELADGTEKLIEGDAIITAFGVTPDKTLIEKLSDIVPETYIIGDAKKQGMLGDAMMQAFYACEEI
jgi:NADPH-dependent 2,4-dienoyl-CoA reductase/sulfur reductase-like enzyme